MRGRRAITNPTAVTSAVSASAQRADGSSSAAIVRAVVAEARGERNTSRSSVMTNSVEKKPMRSEADPSEPSAAAPDGLRDEDAGGQIAARPPRVVPAGPSASGGQQSPADVGQQREDEPERMRKDGGAKALPLQWGSTAPIQDGRRAIPGGQGLRSASMPLNSTNCVVVAHR